MSQQSDVPPRELSPAALAAELASLEKFALGELRRFWEETFPTSPPPIRSADVLRLLLAWQIQEREAGGLDAWSGKRLEQLAETLEQKGAQAQIAPMTIAAGVVLTREWKGVMRHVTVTATGFDHDGKHFRSLSDVARAITGTRWSGPRFFGLDQKRRAKGAAEATFEGAHNEF